MVQSLNNPTGPMVTECRRAMFQASHIIVLDSKTLLDTANSVRTRAFNERQSEYQQQSSSSSSSQSSAQDQ